MIVIVPFTSTQNAIRFSYTLKIGKTRTNQLDHDSIAVVFQLRDISFKRFIKELGILEDNHMLLIKPQIDEFLNI